jgi:flagellum-specific ATP synthase
VRGDVIEPDHLKQAKRVLSLMAIYQDIEDLVNIGAYVRGVNPQFDLAVECRPRIMQYLQQEPQSPSSFEQSRKQLGELNFWIDQAEKLLRVQAAKQTAGGKK